MNSKNGTDTIGLERLKALFGWWSAPNSNANGNLEVQMKRFETFASDLQKMYNEAYSRQMQAAITANECLTQSLQHLMRCHQPRDIIVAESNILATIFEGASLRAKTWAEITQKVGDCCAAWAREAAVEIGEQAREARASKLPVEAGQPAVRQTSKQPARA